MKPKDKKEFEALTNLQDRAKWLLRKGVTAKITMFPNLNRCRYAAYSAGVMRPGDYDSNEAAIAGGTAWLAKMSGLANASVVLTGDPSGPKTNNDVAAG